MTARAGVAALALATAALTGAAAASLGPTPGRVYGAALHVLLAAVALAAPAAVAAQVVVGQLLAASLVVDPAGPGALALLPVVAGVVATAELLGVAGRTGGRFGRAPDEGARRAGLATLLAGGAYGAVALVTAVPGPGGLAAVGLAAAACLGLAVLLRGRVGPAE